MEKNSQVIKLQMSWIKKAKEKNKRFFKYKGAVTLMPQKIMQIGLLMKWK